MHDRLTPTLVHWLAEVHLAALLPLSLCRGVTVNAPANIICLTLRAYSKKLI